MLAQQRGHTPYDGRLDLLGDRGPAEVLADARRDDQLSRFAFRHDRGHRACPFDAAVSVRSSEGASTNLPSPVRPSSRNGLTPPKATPPTPWPSPVGFSFQNGYSGSERRPPSFSPDGTRNIWPPSARIPYRRTA